MTKEEITKLNDHILMKELEDLKERIFRLEKFKLRMFEEGQLKGHPMDYGYMGYDSVTEE